MRMQPLSYIPTGLLHVTPEDTVHPRQVCNDSDKVSKAAHPNEWKNPGMNDTAKRRASAWHSFIYAVGLYKPLHLEPVSEKHTRILFQATKQQQHTMQYTRAATRATTEATKQQQSNDEARTMQKQQCNKTQPLFIWECICTKYLTHTNIYIYTY